MRLRHTTFHCRSSAAAALLASIASLGALSCSDPGRSDSNLLDELERLWAPTGAEPAVDPTPENCRSVAVQRSVRVGEASGESSCEYDAGRALFSCRTALGASGEAATSEAITSEFASLSDFIEAGRSRGKVTSLREVRRIGKREVITRHEYDELGRLVARHEARPEGELVYTYGDYDAADRPLSAQPTRATLEQWGCAAAPLSIEYGDARVRYQYRPTAGCSGSEYSVVERFDVFGNVTAVERFSPAGVEVTFEASAPSATQLLCD